MAEARQSLAEALAGLPEGRPIALSEALATIGARAHGVALLLLGLPDALPLPIPSVSLLVGLPLVAISMHLAIFGENARLPGRLGALSLPVALVRALRERVAPLVGRAEVASRRRWPLVARRSRLVGAVSVWLSLVLLLPIPLFNTPPALCLVLLAWGLVQRDGAFVLAGLVGTVVVTAALAWILIEAGDLLALAMP